MRELIRESYIVRMCDDVEFVEYMVSCTEKGFSGMCWDMYRLSVATNSVYTDRCRNHPYFQDLLGQAYNGRVFE